MLTKTYGYKKLRLANIKTSKKYFLIFASTSSCIAICVSLFIPKYQDRPKYQLPDQIALAEWRSLPSENLTRSLKEPTKAKTTDTAVFLDQVADARRFLYTSPTQESLTIDVLYMKSLVAFPKHLETLGLQYSIDSLNIRHQKMTGYYALFNDQERVYLSACINPRGLSTVTQEQLTSNRNNYDFTPERIAFYLLGFSYVRDDRCLFTTMSIRLENKQIGNFNNNSLEVSYQKLEGAWTNWYQKWQNNFPKN